MIKGARGGAVGWGSGRGFDLQWCHWHFSLA